MISIRCCSLLVVPLLALGSLAGCSGTSLPEMANVSGVILLDGKPLEDVEVVFVPVPSTGGQPSPEATAFSDPEGRFRPQTMIEGASHDAVVLGTHRVVLRDLKTIADSAPDPKQEYAGETTGRPRKSRFSPVFAASHTSPLPAVTIGRGPQELVLKLDSRTKTGIAAVTPASGGS
ncbi:hypothetical protein V5E97_08760 [Singulisphaera sp. Ch08]|uniref:Carboxypeptidase regulatory-like domain-containing protein n=1 Tax=Singulisphaera sp. Ch08 TaxID=3120278 RepID=A0AAU7CM41_9BACT